MVGGAVRASAAAAPLARPMNPSSSATSPQKRRDAASSRIRPIRRRRYHGAQHAERDEGGDLDGEDRTVGRDEVLPRADADRRAHRARDRHDDECRERDARVARHRRRECAAVDERPDHDHEQQSAEPDGGRDEVQHERHDRGVVVRLFARVPLRAHRHERGDREDRDEERGRPRTHREREHRDHGTGDRGDEPRAAALGLDEVAAELRAEGRTDVDGRVERVDEREERGRRGRHGEDRRRDGCRVERDIELALSRLEREQGGHECADHARGGEVDEELRGGQPPAHDGPGIADRERRGSASDHEAPDERRERDHDEDRGADDPQGPRTVVDSRRRARRRSGRSRRGGHPSSLGSRPDRGLGGRARAGGARRRGRPEYVLFPAPATTFFRTRASRTRPGMQKGDAASAASPFWRSLDRSAAGLDTRVSAYRAAT